MAHLRSRKRGDGTTAWQVVGTHVLPTKTFPTQKAAKAYKADDELKHALGELYVPDPERFGDFLQGHLDRSSKSLRVSSDDRKRQTAKHLEPLSKLMVTQVKVAQVEDLLQGLKPNAAGKVLVLVKAVLRNAQARGHRVDEGVFALRKPRYEERTPFFLTVTQMQELTTWLPEFVKRIVPVAGLTGMRQGELFALTDADLCLKGCPQEKAAHLHVRRGKTKASVRRVILTDFVVKLLREQMLARSACGRGRDGRPEPSTGAIRDRLLFPTETGKQWSRHNLMHQHFRPAAKAAGLQGLAFHDLRHTFASLMIQRGAHPKVIAEQLGHTDGGALVLKRYGHLFPGAAAEAVLGLDALVKEEHGTVADEA